MRVVSLKNLTTLISSGSTPLGGAKVYLTKEKGSVMLIRSQNVLMRHLDVEYAAYITDETASKMRRTVVMNNDVLLNITGASIGRVACIEDQDIKANVNQHVCILRPNPNLLYYKYLMHFLAQPSFQARINGKQNGGTRQAITFGQIKRFKIPLPPLEEQKRIAAILDKADAIRRKRKEAIALTEELLRSLFLKVIKTSLITRKIALKSVTLPEKNSFVNGPFGSNLLTSELQDKGVPVIYIRDIRDGIYKRVSISYVTEKKAQELLSCNVISGDVLIAKVGNPPGISAIYPNEESDGIVTQDVIRMRINLEVATPEFISSYINSSIGIHKLKPIIVEATRSRFPLRDLKEIVIDLPEIHVQRRFSQLYKQIRLIQLRDKHQFEQENNLFNSLLQKAFRGEL